MVKKMVKAGMRILFGAMLTAAIAAGLAGAAHYGLPKRVLDAYLIPLALGILAATIVISAAVMLFVARWNMGWVLASMFLVWPLGIGFAQCTGRQPTNWDIGIAALFSCLTVIGGFLGVLGDWLTPDGDRVNRLF